MFLKKRQKLKIISISLPRKNQKIFIGRDILDLFINKSLVQKYFNFIILIDSNVLSIYGDDIDKIKKLLDNPKIIAIEPNENSKTLDFLNLVFEKCSQSKLSRKSCFIAIGGGIVGDITGFIASIYMRGIDFIFIPTTLMAQADTIIDKVAVSYKLLKNIAGSFYSPVLTICDINFLRTLNDKEVVMGFSEIIKHAFIDSEKHFNFIKSTIKNYKQDFQKYPWEEIIYRSLKIKSKLAQKDPFDESNYHKGLSYGHTFANILEGMSGFKLRHGEAVALGMKFSAIVSQNMGIMSKNLFNEQNNIIKEVGLPTTIPKSLNKKTVLDLFKKDKISDNGEINLVILEKLGKFSIQKNINHRIIEKALELFNTIQ
ncbi:MAG: 3-dehydroquinate synthase family protein [Candidatus Paceibacterota bacterium]|jgi:3-dehydroquinate synthase|nr:3-dehydroquinate synthase [Candidatus Paceibacterota bacterium]MDD5555118.1 3-dehydroquinate synthase [Candidatus Paceibacterota bacterium]